MNKTGTTGEVTYEILGHIGVLETNRTGWTREANIVSWNGGPAKVDIREWDPEHERMTRGLTLYLDDALKMQEIIKNNLPSEEDFPNDTPESTSSEFSVNVLDVLGTISTTSHGWLQQVTITSWNGMKPKVDIRTWEPGYEKMTRGITMSREVAETLSNLDISSVYEEVSRELAS